MTPAEYETVTRAVAEALKRERERTAKELGELRHAVEALSLDVANHRREADATVAEVKRIRERRLLDDRELLAELAARVRKHVDRAVDRHEHGLLHSRSTP